MPGVLQFTLGVATGGALSSLNSIGAKMKGITGAALSMPGLGAALAGSVAGFTSLNHAVEKVFDQFEKGAALEHLSRRTGESVANLFSLEKGFKAAGLSGESVSPMLFQMQKALGGFNEFGEPTKDIFAAMGLGVDELKSKGAAAALDDILNKLKGLRSDEAANVAAKIFGRAGAGDAMQLARSTEEFAEAIKKSAQQAELFQRNAAAFAKIERGLAALKGKFNSFWAGIAEGAAPGVQAALDALKGIDFSGMGQKIGQVIGVMIQAIKDGQLGELLSLSLQAGFEKAFTFASSLFGNVDFWAGLGQVALGGFSVLGRGIIEMMMKVESFSSAIWMKIGEEAAAVLTNSKIGQMLGLSPTQARSFKEIFDTNQKGMSGMLDATLGTRQEFMDSAMGMLGDGKKDLKSSIAEAIAASSGGAAGEKLKALFDSLLARIPQGTEAAPGVPNELIPGADKSGGARKQDVNALERIGGIFNFGGLARGNDEARRTASNTGTMVSLLKVTNELLRTGSTGGALTNE